MIRPPQCPICQRQLQANAAMTSDDFPFCSRACREIDLAKWVNGDYAIVENLPPEIFDPELFDPEIERQAGGDDGL